MVLWSVFKSYWKWAVRETGRGAQMDTDWIFLMQALLKNKWTQKWESSETTEVVATVRQQTSIVTPFSDLVPFQFRLLFGIFKASHLFECYLQIYYYCCRNHTASLIQNQTFRGADKPKARPDLKINNWKVATYLPTRRSLLPRSSGWTDKLMIFFF